MPDQEIRRKIQILASRVQGRTTTFTEDVKLDIAIDAKKVTSRENVREILSESLEKSAADVSTRLASHDDSDRIIDDIVNALKK